MHARGKAIAVLVCLSVLSGCATSTDIAQEPAPVESKKSSLSQELLDNVREAEAIQKELDARVEATETKESPSPVEAETKNTTAPQPNAQDSTESPKATPEPTSTQTVAPTIASLAYASFRSEIDQSFTVSDDQVLVGPFISSSQEDSLESALSTAISIWDERIGIIDEYRAILFTVNDLEWADEMTSIYGGRPPSGGTWVSYISSGPWGSDCGPGDSRPKVFYLCVSTKTDEKTIRWQKESIVHEYFHSIQGSLGMTPSNFPIWLSEGTSTYFGHVVANPGSSMVASARNVATRKLTNTFGFGIANAVNNMQESDLSNIYGLLEAGSTSESRYLIEDYAAYQFGGLAVEYLIGTSSYDTFMAFMSDMGSGVYWKTAFSNRFGYTTDEFYKKMYDYLNSVY